MVSTYYRGTNPAGAPPTAQQLKFFRTYCDTSSMKQAAAIEGCSYSHFKNVLAGLYSRLNVDSAVEALFALGWLVPPDRESCGWVGRCSRAKDHTGEHAGFRSV